jgi:response regulator RpfG family c-di-GMP phosphodiesterase
VDGGTFLCQSLEQKPNSTVQSLIVHLKSKDEQTLESEEIKAFVSDPVELKCRSKLKNKVEIIGTTVKRLRITNTESVLRDGNWESLYELQADEPLSNLTLVCSDEQGTVLWRRNVEFIGIKHLTCFFNY